MWPSPFCFQCALIQCADRAVGSQVNAPLLERAVEKLAVWKVELDEEIKVRGIRPHCSQQQSCSAAISMLSSKHAQQPLGGWGSALEPVGASVRAAIPAAACWPALASQPLLTLAEPLGSPCRSTRSESVWRPRRRRRRARRPRRQPRRRRSKRTHSVTLQLYFTKTAKKRKRTQIESGDERLCGQP